MKDRTLGAPFALLQCPSLNCDDDDGDDDKMTMTMTTTTTTMMMKMMVLACPGFEAGGLQGAAKGEGESVKNSLIVVLFTITTIISSTFIVIFLTALPIIVNDLTSRVLGLR